MVADSCVSPCESIIREVSLCLRVHTAESDVVLLHVVPDRAVEVQLCPVVCVHALAVLLFDAAGPLGPPLLVQQAANRSQGAHRDEDHRCDHT